MSIGKARMGEVINAQLVGAVRAPMAKAAVQGRWKVQCRDRNGNLKWEDHIHNLVTDPALQYLLNVGLANSASIITKWYVGLVQTGLAAASADTMSSHAGWSEMTAYAESVLQQWSGAAAANLVVSNSGNGAVFTLNAATAAGGAYLAQGTEKSTTTGLLFAIGAFTGGDRTGMASADTLTITADFRAIDDA